MVEYSQGICQDGAAILKDGQMMTVEEILEALRYHDRLVEALQDMIDSSVHMREEYSDMDYVVNGAEAILAELSAHNGGEG